MIKKCKVLKWNELVMVIDFEGEEVQMPSCKNKEDIVYVKFGNGKYYLSSKEEYDLHLIGKDKKNIKYNIGNNEIDK